MSTASLLDRARCRLRWNDDARDAVEGGLWFGSLDQVLNVMDPEVPLAVYQDAETWYVIGDADMIIAGNTNFGTGLNTWEF